MPGSAPLRPSLLHRRSLLGGGLLLGVGYAAALVWGHRPMQGVAPPRSALGAAGLGTLAAVLDCQLPPGSPVDAIAADVDGFLASGDPVAAGQLRFALALLEHTGGAGPLRLTRFSRRTTDERRAILEAWRGSRLGTKRQIADALRRIALFTWFSRPETWSAIGYDGPWVQR